MNSENINIYKMNDEKEKTLFKNALIFFDTSSLLDFYFFSETARNEIFQKLFDSLAEEGRLWIAAQTEYEFLKNRETVFQKPIDSYDSLMKKDNNHKDSGHLEEIDKIITSILEKINKDLTGQIKTFREKTSKNDKHPYLEDVDFNDFDNETNLFKEYVLKYQSTYKKFRTTVEENVEKQKSFLKSIYSKDTLLEAFEKYFKTTKGFSYLETLKLIEEGNLRYKNQIPPGYLDEKEKLGFQKFGDLILWKQIITKSKEDKKDILLVINDVKEDWWYEKKTPRHELIKELSDETGCNFWMYKIDDFLFKSKQLIDNTIEESTISEAQDIAQLHSSNSKSDFIDWVLSYFDGFEFFQFYPEKKYGGIDYSFTNSAGEHIVLQHRYIIYNPKDFVNDLATESFLILAFASARIANKKFDNVVLVFETLNHSESLFLLENIAKFKYHDGEIRLIIISKDINNKLTTFYDSLIETIE
ncbi:MAG: PIN-like domain-containing protein [Raineya sp.]|jgi:hypothetical protein|nr:PIN-like domain-containing protein [Raineya sp.]